MKVVINTCFGGFGISEKAYIRLITLGVPVRKHTQQERNPETGRYEKEPLNDGEVIFDRSLEEDSDINKAMSRLSGRYWESWIDKNREHPLLIQVVEELGTEADTRFSELKVVEIPDGVSYHIDEYDGRESIHEDHRSWS